MSTVKQVVTMRFTDNVEIKKIFQDTGEFHVLKLSLDIAAKYQGGTMTSLNLQRFYLSEEQ
ncbi:MAG TPA: hypothetical protein VJM50_21085 [Pyrinomonadaceae bacterium]|nr:hypothetical protein [Pyrinomonadaceae bacterium]